METVAVNGQIRTELGKEASRKLKIEERIPCVMYGGDHPIHFHTALKDVKDLIYTADFKLAELNIDGESYRCILKDYQFHPVTDNITHIDFLKLEDGRPIKVEVPVRFKGTSPGVKTGGKLIQSVRKVKIKTVPEKLIDQLTLDVSNLELGHAIRVRDIDVIDGIEIINAPGVPVATVEIPRALKSATSAAEKATKEEEKEEESI